MALSVAYALALHACGQGHGVPVAPRVTLARGFLPVNSADGTRGRVYFFAHAGGLPEFWRSLYSLDNVAEKRFSVLVQAALGRHRCDLSPESPKTRLTRQRDVVHEGRTYRCEWHAKIEPHRNRIHFAVCGQELAGRIRIGVFVDHLDT